jgi:hypothetical protein
LIFYIGVIGAPIAALVAQLIASTGLLTILLIRKVNIDTKDCVNLIYNLAARIAGPITVAFGVVVLLGQSDSWNPFILKSALYILLVLSINLLVDKSLLYYIFRHKISPLVKGV